MLKVSQYFPKLYEPFGRDIYVKVDLSNYASKTDIKNVSLTETSNFALKQNLAGLKTVVDKLDINKLKHLPNNLSSLKSKVDKLDINKLAPVPVDLSKLRNVVKDDVVKKTATNTILNTTTSALTVVQNKIPNVSNLVKTTDYDTKVNEFEKKITGHGHNTYTTTPEFNRLTAENFAARFAQANLETKTDFGNKLSSLNKKISSNKKKNIYYLIMN